jgi:excisionase family DNA binding protein
MPQVASPADSQTQLYRHFNRDGELLYVGISLNALGRLEQHGVVSLWFDEIHRVEIETFASRSAALAAEREAIKSEKPRHNVQHKVVERRQIDPTESRVNESRYDLFVRVCKPVYTIEEVAAVLEVRKHTVESLISSGELGHIELPTSRQGWRPRVRVTGWQLIDYLEHLMRCTVRSGQAGHGARQGPMKSNRLDISRGQVDVARPAEQGEKDDGAMAV